MKLSLLNVSTIPLHWGLGLFYGNNKAGHTHLLGKYTQTAGAD